jgi:hypothetical protein
LVSRDLSRSGIFLLFCDEGCSVIRLGVVQRYDRREFFEK